jgi:DNA-binding response OmpR family regulator
MLTGYPLAEGRAEAILSKADSYLVKPIQIDEFLKTIENRFERQENAVHLVTIAN